MPQKISRIIIFILLISIASIAIILLQIINQLPDIETLRSYIPAEATIIYAADGEILARIHQEENRQVVPLSQISPALKTAVVAVEDPKFYQHHGLDFGRIVRATLKNIVYGRIMEGGSTITQQLARNLFLTRKKTMIRKLAEALLALQLERRYTKEEILELYLNQVYLGHNAYGLESAANLYFGKSAKDLNLGEAAMIAGLIRGPELYSPYRNYKAAKHRQIFILNKMLKEGVITEREAKLAAIATLDLTPKNIRSVGEIAPYFTSYILGELIKEYGEDKVYFGGLKVYTTLDVSLQKAAEEITSRYVKELGEKYDFSQVALVSLDPQTGYVKAMVGGKDFGESQFNRAIQAKRPPGSSFKPFVYAAALEQGISPGIILEDTATTFKVYPNEWNPKGTWEPKNFDEKFRGPVTLRYALEKSLNIPSIKLLERVGFSPAIDMARRAGIKSHLEPALSLTLGASEVTLLEITSAYGTFANGGIRVEPTSILKIEDRQGITLYKHEIKEKETIDPNTVAATIDLMEGVLTRGTGVRGKIDRPAAAKTGTSEEFRDAWFIGFVPQLVTGVWVGNDNNASMKGVAEVAVCPRIWKEYNQIALKDKPVIDFSKPVGLVKQKICLDSGKLAGPDCPEGRVRWDSFWEEDVPDKTCNVHIKEEEEGEEFIDSFRN